MEASADSGPKTGTQSRLKPPFHDLSNNLIPMQQAPYQLWGGRFSGELDALMTQFNDSIGFDIRLWEADIRGSMAYANALAASGIITAQEAAALVEGLDKVREEFAAGTFQVKPGDEDIH